MIGQVHATWHRFSRAPIEIEIIFFPGTIIRLPEPQNWNGTYILNLRSLLYNIHAKTRFRVCDTPTLKRVGLTMFDLKTIYSYWNSGVIDCWTCFTWLVSGVIGLLSLAVDSSELGQLLTSDSEMMRVCRRWIGIFSVRSAHFTLIRVRVSFSVVLIVF